MLKEAALLPSPVKPGQKLEGDLCQLCHGDTIHHIERFMVLLTNESLQREQLASSPR